MIIRVSFTLNAMRKSPILKDYRPDWTSSSKPDYNGGRLMIDAEMCSAGETVEGTIQPIAPEFWGAIKVGDVLRAMEGPKQSGEAVVLSIEEAT